MAGGQGTGTKTACFCRWRPDAIRALGPFSLSQREVCGAGLDAGDDCVEGVFDADDDPEVPDVVGVAYEVDGALLQEALGEASEEEDEACGDAGGGPCVGARGPF